MLKHPYGTIVCTAILCGCVTTNPVSSFYQDMAMGARPEQLASFFEPSAGAPRVITTADHQGDLFRLLEQGYWVIGYSNFTWSGTPRENQLREKALEVGADVVLYRSEYSHTETGVRPMLGVIPGSSTTVSSSGYGNVNTYGSASASAYGSGGYAHGTGSYSGHGYGSYYGTETMSTPPQYYTYNVPYSERINQYQVTFLRKAKPPILGIRFGTIPDDIRTELKRNTGLFIWLVQHDTPAFRANLLPGDILVGIDDCDVAVAQDLGPRLIERAGKEVDVRFLRDGEEHTVPIVLNQLAK